LADRAFADLPDLLRPGDLLVFNDTRVIPARLHARRETGGRVEVLVERVVGERRMLAQLRSGKRVRIGEALMLEAPERLRVGGEHDGFRELEVEGGRGASAVLEALGHVPLPPYIQREDGALDRERYQTVYGRRPGAVAAPTAGLHFDQQLIDRIGRAGVESAYVTLHVGAGTFQPVRVDDLRDHRMHAEWLQVPDEACAAVARARARGGRIVAVGTTSVRALEAAWRNGRLQAFAGETRLFIYPGFRFKVVDAMITNFHLPESTLLMLVCAFAGTDRVLAAYRHAVEQGYRFFSYGDAMFATRSDHKA
jgi:S-adenosylmethionine:tRNA ribosyltransferase-isomerase